MCIRSISLVSPWSRCRITGQINHNGENLTAETPVYDLALVRSIAKRGNINLGRKAAVASRELEYFEAEVQQCIERIQETDFHKTIEYPNKVNPESPIQYDVYKLVCTNSREKSDFLYVKLRISSANWLYVGSFKLK